MVLPKDILNIIYKQRTQLHYQDTIDEYKRRVKCCDYCIRYGVNHKDCSICRIILCNRCKCWDCSNDENRIKYVNKLYAKCLSLEILSLYLIFKLPLLRRYFRSISLFEGLLFLSGIQMVNKIFLSVQFRRIFLKYSLKYSFTYDHEVCLYGLGHLIIMYSVGKSFKTMNDLFFYNQLPYIMRLFI